MKLRFHVKFGENVLEIPDSRAEVLGGARRGQLCDLWRRTVTVYHRLPSGGAVRFVLERCFVGSGEADKTSGVVTNVEPQKTVLIRDTRAYLACVEYHALDDAARADFFTVCAGDFVVLRETDEEVHDAKAFAALQQKYRADGFKVMSIDENIHGLSVDHIALSSV